MRPPKRSTRQRILETLRRRGPRTVADLAASFGLSPVGIRAHLCSLEDEGLAAKTGVRASRGRPARLFGLTDDARHSFPQRSGSLALEVLEEVEALGGRDLVIRALERRTRRVLENYQGRVRARSPEGRIRGLARIRDAEGYLCDTEKNGRTLPDIVERHCPIAEVSERWPEVCRMEAELFGRVLGLPVKREQHMLAGDRCCRYRVGREV